MRKLYSDCVHVVVFGKTGEGLSGNFPKGKVILRWRNGEIEK